jgi:hypothetical protein
LVEATVEVRYLTEPRETVDDKAGNLRVLDAAGILQKTMEAFKQTQEVI